MTDFEREVAHAWNKYFRNNNLTGYAYRRKQSRYTSQVVDVLVDSPDLGYHAIECKSKKSEYGKRLNFKSSFPSTSDGHQIPRTTRFAEKTGRTPLLAVEYRHGRGQPREANIYKWDDVQRLHSQPEAKSIGPKDLKEYKYNIVRTGNQYKLTQNKVKNTQ